MTVAVSDHARVSVSVVIPSWNGCALLVACLQSLAAQTFRDFEIIVVDDASTDNTAETVARDFASVRLVRHEKNRGFCGAVNTGIREARGEHIVLLNNDMTLAPDFLQALVAEAEQSKAALVAPLILWQDQPDVIYGAGDRQYRSGRPESIGFHAPQSGFTFEDDVFGVCAGAALYRREVFDRLGVFDETFEVYFSDSDLSFRARLAGYRARFTRDAIAYHVGSASLFGRTLKRTRQCYINHALLLVKNMPTPLCLRYTPEIVAERFHQARRVFSAARAESGAFFAVRYLFRAWWDMLKVLPHGFSERRRIQRARTISIDELGALLTK